MHAGIVEFDALADAVGTAAQNHDFLLVVHGNFVRCAAVSGVVVFRVFHAADGHDAEGGRDAVFLPAGADGLFRHSENLGQVFVGKAHFLGLAQGFRGKGIPVLPVQGKVKVRQFLHLFNEVRSDAGQFNYFPHGHAAAQEFINLEEAFAVAVGDFFSQFRGGEGFQLFHAAQAGAPDFQRAYSLLKSFLEVLPDAHYFAHGFHLGAQLVGRLGEFFKGPACELHDYIVAVRFVFFQRAFAPVGKFVHRDAGSQLGGDGGDREAGGLGSQGGGTGRTGVDFNNDDAVVFPVVGELHVCSSRDADGVQNAVGIILKLVLHFLRNGQHGRHAEAVSGVHAHGIHVLNKANGNLLSLGVTDDFQFQFLPSQHAFFHQHLVDEGCGQAAGDHLAQFLHVINDAAARAAHGVGGAQHDGVAQLGSHLFSFLHGIDGFGLGDRHADPVHGFLEDDAVFAAGDGFQVHADDFHAVLFQDAFLMQLGSQVQGRLAAQVGQQGIRAFLLNHGRDAVHGQRLNVGVVRHAGVRHDGGGVGIHQNDVVTFGAEGLAGLGAGVVELAGLADDDGA